MPDAEFEAMSGARRRERREARARRCRSLMAKKPRSISGTCGRLVDLIRLVRRTAMQTAVRMITTGVMLALLAGVCNQDEDLSAAVRSRRANEIHSPTRSRPCGGFFRFWRTT